MVAVCAVASVLTPASASAITVLVPKDPQAQHYEEADVADFTPEDILAAFRRVEAVIKNAEESKTEPPPNAIASYSQLGRVLFFPAWGGQSDDVSARTSDEVSFNNNSDHTDPTVFNFDIDSGWTSEQSDEMKTDLERSLELMGVPLKPFPAPLPAVNQSPLRGTDQSPPPSVSHLVPPTVNQNALYKQQAAQLRKRVQAQRAETADRKPLEPSIARDVDAFLEKFANIKKPTRQLARDLGLSQNTVRLRARRQMKRPLQVKLPLSKTYDQEAAKLRRIVKSDKDQRRRDRLAHGLSPEVRQQISRFVSEMKTTVSANKLSKDLGMNWVTIRTLTESTSDTLRNPSPSSSDNTDDKYAQAVARLRHKIDSAREYQPTNQGLPPRLRDAIGLFLQKFDRRKTLYQVANDLNVSISTLTRCKKRATDE